MNMMQAVQSVFANYATFSGRARRAEYWWFYLFAVICNVVLTLADAAIGTGGVLSLVFLLGTLLPSISVAVRRLHDVDRSGWWYFILLVPLVGVILLLVWACTRGTAGTNRFGSDPVVNT